MTILCYHSVDPAWRSPLAVPPDEFARQCAWLSRHRYVVDLAGAVRLTGASGRLPARVSALTFDDGFTGIFDHAFPILARYRLPATIFLVARSLTFGGGPLDWVDGGVPLTTWTVSFEQVRAMQAAGIDFGCHGYSHRDLTALTDDECEREVRESRELLEDMLGRAVPFFAYPGGRHDARVRRIVQRAGYSAAFTLPERPEPVSRFALPRVGVYPGNDVFGVKVKSSRWYGSIRGRAGFPAARAVARGSLGLRRAG